MSNEVTFSTRMSVRKRNAAGTLFLINQDHRCTFRFNMTGSFGPSPGAVAVTVAGNELTLITASLTNPAACWIENTGEYAAHVGIKDPQSNRFHPLLKFRPGMGYPVELSDYVLEELTTGTGTGAAAYNQLWAISPEGATTLMVGAYQA